MQLFHSLVWGKKNTQKPFLNISNKEFKGPALLFFSRGTRRGGFEGALGPRLAPAQLPSLGSGGPQLPGVADEGQPGLRVKAQGSKSWGPPGSPRTLGLCPRRAQGQPQGALASRGAASVCTDAADGVGQAQTQGAGAEQGAPGGAWLKRARVTRGGKGQGDVMATRAVHTAPSGPKTLSSQGPLRLGPTHASPRGRDRGQERSPTCSRSRAGRRHSQVPSGAAPSRPWSALHGPAKP